MPRLDPDILTDFATLIFEASELPPDVARQVAESLVLANLSGHDSHGVIRIIEYVAWTKRGWVNPHGQLTVVREQPCILILDGDFGFGQVIGRRAMELGIVKAKTDGACILSLLCEVFAGAMTGAGCSKDGVERVANGFMAFLLDPAAFAGTEFVSSELGNLAEWVKSSRLQDGFDRIQFPGEPEAEAREERSRSGIDVDDRTWQKICEIAAAVNVAIPAIEDVRRRTP